MCVQTIKDFNLKLGLAVQLVFPILLLEMTELFNEVTFDLTLGAYIAVTGDEVFMFCARGQRHIR